jgi:hypothetical protein
MELDGMEVERNWSGLWFLWSIGGMDEKGHFGA